MMNDLISRQAAIDAIEEYMQDSYIRDADIICSDLQHEINILPSAEPKTGKWHKTENEEMEITGYYCSVCDMPTDEPTNYCGNCGAKMKGGEQSE